MTELKTIEPIKNNNKSSIYHCIHSIQKLNSQFDTNVLASNIPIEQLLKNRDILLVDDLRGDARWGMNKVIQRNISTQRVEEIKKEYLEANNRLIKFFPSITVILLPKTEGEPEKIFSKDNRFFDDINGVTIEKNYKGSEFVYDLPVELSWDKNVISALVIDGQHRVSALRSYYDKKNEKSFLNISIPVTFVIFKNNPAIDLIQATRALFIDVNNTPRLVSEEKLIFIDDRNIHRRISSKVFGSNDPGDHREDFYQMMLEQDDFLVNNNDFINRYFVEESGKDDEEKRGFLSNHKTLFPWEISNIMTIHRNILGSILLKYKDVDKTRDIRSICWQLNSTILDEIESTESVEDLNESNVAKLYKRLEKTGLSKNEIEIFKRLIIIKKQNLEEIQQAKGDFFIGTSADQNEEQDRIEFINLLKNVYNQDCSKDSAFELSATNVSSILKEGCSIYVELLTYVFNHLWFTQEIKQSILNYKKLDRKLIFNFIIATHESLKIEGKLRRRADKVERQISNFLKENTIVDTSKNDILSKWAYDLEKNQKSNLLRTVVGQEMLFLFIIDQNTNLNLIDKNEIVELINSLGSINFFDSESTVKLTLSKFPEIDFNPWSQIIMKGKNMSPGITNALKGADLIFFVKEGITDRITGASHLRRLDRLQKAYGVEIVNQYSKEDKTIIYKMYKFANKHKKLASYLNSNEISTISENFPSANVLTPKAENAVSKFFGALGLEQIISHFNKKI